jgi:hypothetical protein
MPEQFQAFQQELDLAVELLDRSSFRVRSSASRASTRLRSLPLDLGRICAMIARSFLGSLGSF